jgi:hypothetical protein
MEAEIMGWLAQTAVGAIMRDTSWAFPAAEILHFIGLCALFGSLLVVDLRVLGFGRQIAFSAVMPFIRVAIAAVVLNTVTGVAFVASDPPNYWDNPGFRWKLVLVVLACANAMAFEVLERKRLTAAPVGVDAGARAKFIAATSLTLWVGVIVLGRLLPYTGYGNG